jgi:hypothetical protein
MATDPKFVHILGRGAKQRRVEVSFVSDDPTTFFTCGAGISMPSVARILREATKR